MNLRLVLGMLNFGAGVVSRVCQVRPMPTRGAPWSGRPPESAASASSSDPSVIRGLVGSAMRSQCRSLSGTPKPDARTPMMA